MNHKITKKSEQTFRRLLEGMSRVGDHIIIDNTNGTFMAVHVEIIGSHNASLVVSVAHYFEQNGDLCADPEMTFLVNDMGIYPMTFQQAIPPVFTEAGRLGEHGIEWNERLQTDITSFANMWMANIQQQQF